MSYLVQDTSYWMFLVVCPVATTILAVWEKMKYSQLLRIFDDSMCQIMEFYDQFILTE